APEDFAKLGRFSERVRLLEDTNHDGRADRATVFADGFNKPEDGIAAGVLAHGTNVYFACIPNLWRLSDTNGDGKADVRDVLSTGYGVHIAFIGHDLHGLTMGPDGRLYFSIGDRGINVTNKEGKVLFYPDEGVVLRSEPDGANLEVFHRGLRNPQELVFNEYGDLFTADNNSDGGDRARLVHLIEGGDSGWRVGYQHLTKPPRRGPWNGEQLWRPHFEGQPAWILPPIANLGYGPSGLTHYPGTGLNDHYRGHFFLCDFRGGASSGIHTFTLKPKGASFELATYDQFVWECLPTDVAFGPDGALYFSDWVEGWNKTGKGRIYRTFDPATVNSKEILETKKLLAEGMAKRSERELVELLGHGDMRVRMEAQFELAAKGTNSFPVLRDTALKSKNRFARLHSIWAIGQITRALPLRYPVGGQWAWGDDLFQLTAVFADNDAELRGQMAKMLAEVGLVEVFDVLPDLLSDESMRVRFQVLLGCSRFAVDGHGNGFGRSATKGIQPVDLLRKMDSQLQRFPKLRERLYAKFNVKDIPRDEFFETIRRHGAQDQILRHTASRLMSWYPFYTNPPYAGAPQSLVVQAMADKSSVVRMAAVVALRAKTNSVVADLLQDKESFVCLEAARAICDVPIDGAMPALGALLAKPHILQKFTELDAASASRTASVPQSQLAISNQQFPVSNDTVARSASDHLRKPASGVEAAISSVATETGSWTFTEQLFYRVINANFRLGQPEHATALARFAANSAVPASLRAEALSALADWAKPSSRDRVMGLHRPLAPRDPQPAAKSAAPNATPSTARADRLARS
ncbi:MAG: PQQ-dependent sugar dehydrogenase, partial [Verrucomicrobiales bacterium]|nr:PQQ-dependent sugar dehydrogenase [Verrucomicrobiales bacterium]